MKVRKCPKSKDTAQNVGEVLGDNFLLLDRTVVLERQNHRISVTSANSVRLLSWSMDAFSGVY